MSFGIFTSPNFIESTVSTYNIIKLSHNVKKELTHKKARPWLNVTSVG